MSAQMINCPECRASLKISVEGAKKVRCPKCGCIIVVPPREEVVPASPPELRETVVEEPPRPPAKPKPTRATGARPKVLPQAHLSKKKQPSRSRLLLIVCFLLAGAFLVLVGVVGVAAWILIGGGDQPNIQALHQKPIPQATPEPVKAPPDEPTIPAVEPQPKEPPVQPAPPTIEPPRKREPTGVPDKIAPPPAEQPKTPPASVPTTGEPGELPKDPPVIAGRSLKQWIARLKDPNVKLRETSVKILGQTGPIAIWLLPQLYDALINDEAVTVRTGAAHAIGKFGPRAAAAAPGLLSLLEDRNEPLTLRAKCAEALAQIGDNSAVPFLARSLKDPELVYVATNTLVQIGAKPAPAFAEGLKDADSETRLKCLHALVTYGDRAEAFGPVLVPLLTDPDMQVRRLALRAVKDLDARQPAVVVALGEALKDTLPLHQELAAEALQRLGPEAAAVLPQVMAAVSAKDTAPPVRAKAASVLGRIGRQAQKAVPDLAKLLTNEDQFVRGAAAEALLLIRAPADVTVKPLLEALKRSLPGGDQRVLSALSFYGPEIGAGAIPDLVVVLKTRGPNSGPAMQVLKQIGKPAVPALLQLLNDQDGQMKGLGADVVRQMPPIGAEVVAPLRAALKDDKSFRQVMMALERQGPDARPAAADLVEQIKSSPFPDVPPLAGSFLQHVGVDETTLPLLAALVNDPNPARRRGVARALGGASAGAEVNALIETLSKDNDKEVRTYAEQSSLRLQQEPQVQGWRKDLKSDDPALRFEAAVSLLRFDRREISAVPALVAALAGEDLAIRRKAAETLALAGDSVNIWEVQRAMIRAADEATEELRPGLLEQLGKISFGMNHYLYPRQPQRPVRPPSVPPREPARALPVFASLPLQRTRAQAEGESSIQTVVRLLVPARAGTDPPVVVLERATDSKEEDRLSEFRGLLARELVRQAFLLTARDELGLPTRDLSLRETFPESAAYTLKSELILSVRFPSRKQAQVAIVRPKGKETEVLWSQEIALPQEEPFDYLHLAEALERLSREAWPAVLRQAGFGDGAPRRRGQARAPANIAGRLETMAHTAQFAALRELNAAMRTEGESPWLMADVVRANANLGVLTEFLWNPVHKVCMARALLYSQRLTAAEPKSPWGLWHRAYAEALAGLHAAALADLAEAAKLEAAGKGAEGAPPRPVWVDVIDAHCRFDLSKLAREQGQLAKLLHYLAAESKDTPQAAIVAARPLLQENPECYRVIDGLCVLRGVRILHMTTSLGPKAYADTLLPRLREMPGLPGAVAARLQPGADEKVDEVELLRTLTDASALERDTAEPAWSSLAWMYRETRFVHCWRRAEFMKNEWFVPTEEYVQTVLPLVADHPYRHVLPIVAYPGQTPMARDAIAALQKTADPNEVMVGKDFLTHYVNWGSKSERGSTLAKLHMDDTHHDWLLRLWRAPQEGPATGRRLATISPYAPAGRGERIIHDWDTVQKEAAAWETAGDQPLILRALVVHYRRLNRPADYERMLKGVHSQNVVMPPSHTSLQRLELAASAV